MFNTLEEILMKLKNIIIASLFSFSPYILADDTPKNSSGEIQNVGKGARNSGDAEHSAPTPSSSDTDTKSSALTPDISHPSENPREKSDATALPGDNSGKKR